MTTKSKTNGIAHSLATLLSDTYVLTIKTQNYHWNVMDHDFRALHAFFEEQYNELLPVIDLIAERIRKLGQFSPGSMTEMLKLTDLKEDTGHDETAATMIAHLLADQQHMIHHCKKVIKESEDAEDPGTADMLTAQLRLHEKHAWMLAASLKKQTSTLDQAA
jgi:starvation-inducible DNA-binding protein